MEKNKKIVVMSILIALVALLIIILALSFILMNQKTKKAHVENLIDPLAGLGDTDTYHGSMVNIHDGDDDKDDDDDDDPIDENPMISSIPDVTMQENTVDSSIDLDNYVQDDDHSDSQLTWTVSGNTNIAVSIDNSTHVVTLTPASGWFGAENVTFRVEDPDGNYDTDTILVTVTGTDDPTQWTTSLPNREINEDSKDGTVIISNIYNYVNDPDSPITITVGSNSHFDIELNGNNLVLDDLQKHWHGSETVVVYANGVPETFRLTVKHLLDDCEKICAWGTCYELCD